MGLTIILPIIVAIPVKSAHRTFEPSSGVRVFTRPTAVKSASARICGMKDRHRATGRSIRLERPIKLEKGRQLGGKRWRPEAVGTGMHTA